MSLCACSVNVKIPNGKDTNNKPAGKEDIKEIERMIFYEKK